MLFIIGNYFNIAYKIFYNIIIFLIKNIVFVIFALFKINEHFQ